MSSLIIFVLFFILSSSSYIGGQVSYALSFLLGWYIIVSIPIIFIFIVQTWAYIATVNNPSIIKVDPNIDMPQNKALNIVFKAYQKSFGTLTSAIIFLFIKILLTSLSLYFISPMAVSISGIGLVCLILLMSLNIYHFIRYIKKYR